VEVVINQSKKSQINLGLINAVLFNLNFYTKFYNDKRGLEFFYALDLIYSKMDNIEKIHIGAWEFIYSKVSHLLTEKKELRHTPVNKDKPWIIITFTTCKRLDLFKQTINSILNHWEDYEKIDYWFCVDDNSSDEDREKMREICPWMEFNMKTPDKKGHRESMNIIWEKLNTLKPKYWIHMEDDFVFHKKMPYIKKGIEGLSKFKTKNVKQVLFNRNYAERIDGYRIKGHEKLDDGFSMHKHNNEKVNYINCHYWQHYSFRPSIIDVETILSLGNYDSENQFFEMDYANKWNKHNYKSAFFDFITNRHIGRLTSERADKNKPNAYQLNEESQFTKEKKSHIKIVNLERRKDRKNAMIKKLQEQNIKNYEFIKAVDGKELKPTKQIDELFKGNDFQYRRGVIGCALSHYNLWVKLLNDPDNNYYIIFEDDIEFTDNFNKIFPELEKSGCFSTSECIMLGYHMNDEDRKKLDINNNNNNEINIEKINKDFCKGGTFAYSINKQGAKKIVDYISKNNIKNGIDTVMGKVDTLVMGQLNPQLVESKWVNDMVHGDPDAISKGNFSRLIYKDLTDEFVFIKGVDHHGDDYYYNNDLSIQEMMEHAYYNDECVGFNTLGFFKNTVRLLKSSHFFSDTDGIYVKKSMVNSLQSQIKEIEKQYGNLTL
jgi:GR25 family glycosyltransferase involved in LPS biosynthesis